MNRRMSRVPLACFGLAAASGLALLAAPAPVIAQDVAEATAAPEKPAKAEDAELQSMKDELQRLTTEYQLMQQRQKNAMLVTELQKQELSTLSALAQAKLEEELAALKAQAARLQAEMAVRKAQQDAALADAQAAIETRSVESRLQGLDAEEQLKAVKLEGQRLAAENQVMQEQVKRAQMQAALAREEYDREMSKLRGELDLRKSRDEVEDRVFGPLDYPDQPFVDGVLSISDRRIPLNGTIGGGTADFVCDRIDFFNNQSTTKPIFIVIDNSPGGSVMEGYRIVKCIESSPAPVHVLVKSFAASMAAVITTLAPHSYCYPNAIILHHQMSSSMCGNLTQQAEQLQNSMEWAKRLADPVAQKMGLTYDQLVEQMYVHNSDGDWQEFGNKAVDLKWVDHVVNEIREEGLRARPTGSRASLPGWMEAMKVDEKGRPFVQLPPLQPFDHYFIYDPFEFYRW